jgi:hypothetical protein
MGTTRLNLRNDFLNFPKTKILPVTVHSAEGGAQRLFGADENLSRFRQSDRLILVENRVIFIRLSN